MESLPSYVKDTSDFITKIHNLKGIPQNAFLVTLDVTSLYSNIPHDDGVKACDHFMTEGGKSQEARSVISKLRPMYSKHVFVIWTLFGFISVFYWLLC